MQPRIGFLGQFLVGLLGRLLGPHATGGRRSKLSATDHGIFRHRHFANAIGIFSFVQSVGLRGHAFNVAQEIFWHVLRARRRVLSFRRIGLLLFLLLKINFLWLSRTRVLCLAEGILGLSLFCQRRVIQHLFCCLILCPANVHTRLLPFS